MEIFIIAMLIAFGLYTLRSKAERQRIMLLGSHLVQYDIEKLMETLAQGYMRALGEEDLQRRESIWTLLDTSEVRLGEQFKRLAAGFTKVDEAAAQVNHLPWPLSLAASVVSSSTIDMRKLLAVHAKGIAETVENSLNKSRRDKAFTLSAEIFLMQHSCHWFCKSRSVASARLLVRHQTSYEQVLKSVSPQTRKAYLALVGS